MSYVDYLPTFDSGLEDWVANPATGDVTMSRETGDGDPGAGCLSTRVDGKNKNVGESYWEWSGTFEQLGVPPGATVTAIGTDPNNDYNWRCSEWQDGYAAANLSGSLDIWDDVGPSLIGEIIPDQSAVSGTTSWAAATGGAEVALSSLASDTVIHLRIYTTLRTGNANGAYVTILQDTIALRITYTAGAAVNKVLNVMSNMG